MKGAVARATLKGYPLCFQLLSILPVLTKTVLSESHNFILFVIECLLPLSVLKDLEVSV